MRQLRELGRGILKAMVWLILTTIVVLLVSYAVSALF